MRYRLGLSANFMIVDCEKNPGPLRTVIVTELHLDISVTNSDRLLMILRIEVIHSDVWVAVIAMNEVGSCIKRSTWREFYEMADATDLTEGLSPRLVHLTDFCSEMLRFDHTRIPDFILYRWPQPEDESSDEVFPFLVYALASYSLRLHRQDLEHICNQNT
jgi:hypothetical protein